MPESRTSQRTQTDQAYAELSHRIFVLAIPSNERIKEQAWAKKLGVNRSAIRESLTRLLGEGLVYQGERGGFFVAEMTDDEVRELREVREILETAAITLACKRATAKQLKALQTACDDFMDFVAKGYHSAAHEADLRFHHQLIASAGNSRLAQVYQRSRIPLFHRKVARMSAHREDFEKTEKEHRAVLEAMRKRDDNAAIRALVAHFNRGEREATS